MTDTCSGLRSGPCARGDVTILPMRGYPSWSRQERRDDGAPTVRTVRSRGHTISYEDTGTGEPVVLIPGYTMSAADWRDCGYVDGLATARRVISVDPLGHGLSDKPRDPAAYPWPDVASDIVAAMDSAGIERAAVWGYSRGADLAGVVASNFPDRVTALILGGQDLTWVPPEPAPWALALAEGDWLPFWDLYAMPDEDRRYCAKVGNARALGAVHIGARSSGYAIDLSRITAPALVYCGGNDDPDEVTRTADALGVELQVLPGLDHSDAFSPVGGGTGTLEAVLPLVHAHLERNGP